QEFTVITEIISTFRKENFFRPSLLLKLSQDELRSFLHALNESISSANALVMLYRSHLESALTSHSTFDAKQLEIFDENLEKVLRNRDMLAFLKKDALRKAFGASECKTVEEFRSGFEEFKRLLAENCTLLDGWRRELEELVEVEMQ